MKPLHVLLISLLTATPLTAILDTNQNTLSDLWEAAHNNQQLLDPQDPDHQPTADPDGDGWTNLEESVAGTDPFSSLSPGGMLRPDLANHPATYGDPVNGIPQLITPEAISLTWPTVPGKTYQIQYSADLTPNSWSFLPETLVGSGQNFTITIPLTQNNGSPPDALFWRISITDLDSDGDTLTNAEEISLTTNPNHSDSDLDGIPDNLDSAPLASATQADPDGLGLANANLLAGLKANWSFEEATIPFANLFGKNEARCENHAPASTPSWPVLVPLNLSGSSAFQRRGFVSQGLPIADKSIFGDGKIFTGITNSFTLSFWHRFQKDSIKNGSNIYKCLWILSDCRPAQSSISSNTLAIRKKNATEEEVYLGAYTWTGSGGNPHSTIIGKSFTRPLGTADDGKWHHYTIVRSSGKFTLLIDGVTMPGLNDATVPWLDIPLNKATPTSPTDYTYDWNTFGRMAPNLAHNQTLGTFDRIRLWSRPLTSNETNLLYQEDIDNDGLWDKTENNTELWFDTDLDSSRESGEYHFRSSPFLWETATRDSDGDGLTDLDEQNIHHTDITHPDSDGDLLPDGWEVENNLDPLDGTGNDGKTGDPDSDGLDNFGEFSFASNPHATNTDGDSSNDGAEASGGSNPSDPDDEGQPLPSAESVTILIGIGDESTSQSEDYHLNIFRIDPTTGQEIRFHTHRSGGHGSYSELPRSIFKKGETYTFQIDWQSSAPGGTNYDPAAPPKGPDYDYTFKITLADTTNALLFDSYDADSKTFDSSRKILALNASDVAENHTDFEERYERYRVLLCHPDLDVIHPGSGRLVEGREDTDDGGYVSLRRTVGSDSIAGSDVAPVTKLLIPRLVGVVPAWQGRLKFLAGGRYSVFYNEGRTLPVVSEQTVFPLTADTTLYLQGTEKSPLRGKEKITLQLLVGGQWIDTDAITLTVVQSEFLVQIKAFIPYEWTEGEELWLIEGFNPMEGKIAQGDDRKILGQFRNIFSDRAVNFTDSPYRLCQEVVLTLYPDLHDFWQDKETLRRFTTAPTSDHYEKAVSVDPSELSVRNGYLPLTPPAIASGPPIRGVITYSPELSLYNSLRVNKCALAMTAWGKDGAMGIYADASPAIDWSVRVEVDSSVDPLLPVIRVVGDHDLYPAYEIIVLQADGSFKDIHRHMPNRDVYLGPISLSTAPSIDFDNTRTINQ
jgi:hypothetical protein